MLLAPSLTHAAPARYDLMSYQAPKGWTVDTSKDVLTIQIVDLKKQPDLLASVLDIVAQMQGNMGLFTVADTTLARLAALQERTGRRRDLAMTLTGRALNAIS